MPKVKAQKWSKDEKLLKSVLSAFTHGHCCLSIVTTFKKSDYYTKYV